MFGQRAGEVPRVHRHLHLDCLLGQDSSRNGANSVMTFSMKPFFSFTQSSGCLALETIGHRHQEPTPRACPAGAWSGSNAVGQEAWKQ